MIWGVEATARLRTLLEAEGFSSRQAAEAMGISRSAIIGAAHRLGIQFARSPERQIEWNEDNIGKLRSLAHEQLPASAIARIFNCSRNTINSAAKRYGIFLTISAQSPASRQGKEGRITARVNARKATGSFRLEPLSRADLEPTTPDPFLCIPLLDLEPHQCRYPHGDETITFCGQQRAVGSSYCPFHARLCSPGKGYAYELSNQGPSQTEHPGADRANQVLEPGRVTVAQPECGEDSESEHREPAGLDELLDVAARLPDGDCSKGEGGSAGVEGSGLGDWRQIGEVASEIVRRIG